jgi:hypothetical protein
MNGRIRTPNVIKTRLPYQDFTVYAHSTPEDGHCMLHAIAMAIYPRYQTSDAKTKLEIVKQIRKELLVRLNEINPKSGKSNYKTIANGAFADSADWNERSGTEYLKQLLSSSQQLGEETKIILEFFIEKNILIVDGKTNRLYMKHDFNPSRSCIVLYYTVLGDNEKGEQIGHFEMISVQDRSTGNLVRHFTVSHPFVGYLLEA